MTEEDNEYRIATPIERERDEIFLLKDRYYKIREVCINRLLNPTQYKKPEVNEAWDLLKELKELVSALINRTQKNMTTEDSTTARDLYDYVVNQDLIDGDLIDFELQLKKFESIVIPYVDTFRQEEAIP